jgi:hypothetical protein
MTIDYTKFCLERLTKLKNKIANTTSPKQRLGYFAKFLEFSNDHKYFLYATPKLANTVYDKALETKRNMKLRRDYQEECYAIILYTEKLFSQFEGYIDEPVDNEELEDIEITVEI